MKSVGTYCFSLFFSCYCSGILKAMPFNSQSTTVKSSNYSFEMSVRDEQRIQNTILSNKEELRNVEFSQNMSKGRVKRQSGAGKFVEAADMPQLKLVRLFLQMFKNLWDSAYVGGSHPFHPNVPKTVMELYKQKIVEFFIPDIQEAKT